MDSLELALIPAGAALAGVVLGGVGSAWRDRTGERRTRMRERDRAIAELLTAAVDLMSGIQAIRSAYDRATGGIGCAGEAGCGLPSASRSPPKTKVTRDALLDWRKRAPLIGELLAIDQGLLEQQRTITLDMTAVVLSRASRFYAAVTALTLGSDEKIAAAVRDLTPAVTRLMEVIGVRGRKYAQAPAAPKPPSGGSAISPTNGASRPRLTHKLADAK